MPRGPHPYKGIPRHLWPKGALKTSSGEPAKSDAPINTARETSNVSLDVPVAQPSTTGRPDRPKAPPSNLFSGKIQKLVLIGKDDGRPLKEQMDDPVPGYKTHWIVDYSNSGARLEQARATGWEYIACDEVALNEGLAQGNTDLGSHVRQIAGVENGVPFYMYAMKKPRWIEEAHKSEYERSMIEPIKDALKKGKISSNPGDRQFAAGDDVARATRSSLPPIEIGTKTYR